jgi:hypothetical protein
MGHIVLGEPRLDRFHLHDRVRRALRQRGHRVVLACTTPALRTFWRHQEGGEDVLGERALPRFFATARPDLLLLHQDRTDASQALAAAAAAAGTRVLWSGAGLLPHTLQLDEAGTDDRASWTSRTASQFEVVPVDENLLQTSLAHALADAEPVALPRAPVRRPPWPARLGDALAAWRGGPGAMQRAFTAWRLALPGRRSDAGPGRLPTPPFAALLLQRDDDPRLAAADARIAATALVRATAAAVGDALPGTGLVVVLPAGARARATFAGHPAVPPDAGPIAAATAAVTVTVNHPHACVALLAGTPVVATGRSAWSLPGVAVMATPTTLADGLARALAAATDARPRHFLTWLLRHGHVWCSPTMPDHNGITGLVQALEARLPTAAKTGLRYRTGPAWPLLP